MKLYLLEIVIPTLIVLTTAASVKSADPEGIKITFDGPTSDQKRSKRQDDYEPEIPDECKRLGYCLHVPNYPDELVKNLLAKGIDKDCVKLTMDILNEPLKESNTAVNIVSRLGGTDSNDTVPLCEAKYQIIYPQAAPDANNTWRAVINPKDNPVQSFRVEICSNPDNQCTEVMSVQDGYASVCQQEYEYRTIASFDQESGSIKNRDLKFPSTCSCVIHKVS